MVHLASLVVALGLLLFLGRHLWFFFDEWSIVGNRQLPLLQPHNEHWSSLPYLVYRGLYPIFGLRQYLPYLAVVIALHVAVAHLLWRVMRRADAHHWIATGVACAFLVFGAGAENLYWAWQMSFVGSVFFGLLMVLLVDASHPSPQRMALVWLASLAAVMSSGIGVAMVGVAGLTALMRRGPRAIVVSVGPAAAAYALWWLIERPKSLYTQFSLPGELHFVAAGLASAGGNAIGHHGVGVLAVGILLVWLAVSAPRLWRAAPAILALGGGAVLLYALIAVGRLRLGVAESGAPRYTYVAGALLLPAAGMVLSSLAQRNRYLAVAIALLILVVGLRDARLLVQEFDRQTALTTTEERRVLAGAQILNAPATFGLVAAVGSSPDTLQAPTLRPERLRQYIRNGALPAPSGTARPQRLDVWTALAGLGTTISPGTAFGTRAPASLQAADRVSMNALPDGCASARPLGPDGILNLIIPEPGAVDLVPDRTTTVVMSLIGPDGTAALRPFDLAASGGHIANGLQNADLQLTGFRATLRICPLQLGG